MVGVRLNAIYGLVFDGMITLTFCYEGRWRNRLLRQIFCPRSLGLAVDMYSGALAFHKYTYAFRIIYSMSLEIP